MPTSQTQSELDQLLNFSERVGTVPAETNAWKRAKDIIYRPATTWSVIAQEEGGLKEAFLPYTVMVGLVPMVIGAVLSTTLFGAVLMFMGSPGLGLAGAIYHSVLAYAYWMFGILALGKILELSAPSFGLRASWVLSCRVLVYASTPSLLIGAVTWIPFLGWLLSLMAFVRSALLAYRGAAVVLKLEQPVSNDSKGPQAPAVETATKPKTESELVKI